MNNRRVFGIILRVFFFFVIVGVLYFAVYCPLSRVTGALQ